MKIKQEKMILIRLRIMLKITSNNTTLKYKCASYRKANGE
jgi:hypothetical protein